MMPPLTNAADAVALLTARNGADDGAVLLALTAITGDITAWPALVFLADVNLHLLGRTTDDVAAAVRSIAVAVA